MMKNEKDAIERWAEGWSGKPVRELTAEEATNFMMVAAKSRALDSDSEVKEMLSKRNLEECGGFGGVLWQRVRALHTYEITPSLAVLMSMLVHNFAESTMYANYFQYWAHKHKKKVIGIQEFALMFPMGILTEDALHGLWIDQKVSAEEFHGSDNGLDFVNLMESIREV